MANMALIMRGLYNFYNFTEELKDSRTQHLPLMDSIFYPLTFILLYITFVFMVGPNYMKNRKPFNLKEILIAYNLFQIVACMYITVESVRYVIPEINWRCAVIDEKINDYTIYTGFIIWCYYFLKITDLLDTVFFILKKNDRQISFLHLYHHGGMILVSWVMARYLSNGHAIYFVALNSFVHIIMYLYYLLTAFDSSYKRNITLKKRITQLQLLQFTIGFFLFGQLLFRPNCTYPFWPSVFVFVQNFVIVFLFLNFYYQAYLKKPKRA